MEHRHMLSQVWWSISNLFDLVWIQRASVFVLVNDKDMKNNSTKEDNNITLDIPALGLADGNWKTIDNADLFDENKCDLTRCDLNDLYRIFG